MCQVFEIHTMLSSNTNVCAQAVFSKKFGSEKCNLPMVSATAYMSGFPQSSILPILICKYVTITFYWGKKKFPMREQSALEIPTSEFSLQNFPSSEQQQMKDFLANKYPATKSTNSFT